MIDPAEKSITLPDAMMMEKKQCKRHLWVEMTSFFLACVSLRKILFKDPYDFDRDGFARGAFRASRKKHYTARCDDDGKEAVQTPPLDRDNILFLVL
jgi:hypothetical protein